MRTCTEPECDRPHKSKGLCARHYSSAYRSSRAVACTAGENCTRPAVARAMCSTHYSRWRRTGAVTRTPRRTTQPLRLPDDSRFTAAYGNGTRLEQWRGVQRLMLLDGLTELLDQQLETLPLGHTLGYRITFDRKPYPRSKRWQKDVLRRDEHRCQRCGATEHLHAHHLLAVSLHPELADRLDNGITLCTACHALTHEEQGDTNLTPFIRKEHHGQP